MALALMIGTSEDAFVCDMAEYYGVLDYRALPVPLLATLAAGLRPGCRILQLMDASVVDASILLLSSITDMLRYMLGSNQPLLVDALTAPPDALAQAAGEYRSFDSGADFDAARAAIIGGDG